MPIKKWRYTIQMTNDSTVYILPLVNFNVYWPIIGHLYWMTSFFIGSISCFPKFRQKKKSLHLPLVVGPDVTVYVTSYLPLEVFIDNSSMPQLLPLISNYVWSCLFIIFWYRNIFTCKLKYSISSNSLEIDLLLDMAVFGFKIIEP